MKKTIITIMLAFIVSASIAQNAFPTLTNITFTLQSSNPVLTWEKGSIKDGVTPIDTTYEMYGDKPLRRIAYRYRTKDDKPMEFIKKDVYNGKDWDFNSIAIRPITVFLGGVGIIGNGTEQYLNGGTLYLTTPVRPAKKP